MTKESYLKTKRSEGCTGCGACAYVCPTGAIAMVEDDCGFEYPGVDESKCVNCGRCLRACHMNISAALKRDEPLACFGAIDKDAESLRRSASGGVAAALSRLAVEEGGAVYGCVADREDVHHERLADQESLSRAQGSKYVQSDLSRTYAPLEADLKAGRDVLFVGTPCQCAAMRTLFGKHENLTTVDLVCEGVPSRRMYKDFLDDLERERGEKVTDFRFRNKRGGWSTKNAVVLGEGGRILDKQPHSYYYYYYYLFTRALILRDSCYECPYACANRVGDVTIGDFWGVETAGLGYGLKDFKSGVSCALVNSERGREGLCAAQLELKSSDRDTIVCSNGCLEKASSARKELRERVLDAYVVAGADGMKGEYEKLFPVKARLKADLTASLPLALRTGLKRAKVFLGEVGR